MELNLCMGYLLKKMFI